MEATDLASSIVTSIGHGCEVSKEDEERARELGLDFEALVRTAKQLYELDE